MPNIVAYVRHFDFKYILVETILFSGTNIFICMEIEAKKYQRPQIEVFCGNPKCNKSFMKDGSEVRRNKKRGADNYCSQSCSSIVNHKQLHSGNVQYLSGHTKADKYTGLREHLRRAKYRNQEVNITLDDLLEQWTKQDGLCPYTGSKLIHPIRLKDEGLIYMASLDRIDSKIGYMKGNIQFISAAANLAKNNMTHEHMIEFCKLISNKWKNG
jgi:hypothetical protein